MRRVFYDMYMGNWTCYYELMDVVVRHGVVENRVLGRLFHGPLSLSFDWKGIGSSGVSSLLESGYHEGDIELIV